MTVSISKEFGFAGLVRFALPSIIMMMFMSLYTVIDGFFVSRFIGTLELSAVNITYPLTSILIGISVMFATGGSAVVATQIGEKKLEAAQRNFTLIVISAVLVCALIALCCIVWLEPIVHFLGAKGALSQLAINYVSVLLIFSPIAALQILFQSLFVTAGRPKLGLLLTIAGGICNIVFDYVFIVVCGMGIAGAAYATALGYCIPAIGGFIFFCVNKKGLHFARPRFCIKTLREACFNGSSEMVTNVSTSVTTLLFNILVMHFAGSDGVAAITVVLYCQFLMTSLFMGFSIGVAPIISYHHGALNKVYLKKLYKMCGIFVLIASAFIFIMAISFPSIIASLFVPRGSDVHSLAIQGLSICSLSFLFAGSNIFMSGLFTALSDGRTSAILSFSRTFLFTVIGILILSWVWGLYGLWFAIPFAEMVTIILALRYYRRLKRA